MKLGRARCAVILAGLTLALTSACLDGCAHERGRDDLFASEPSASLEQLEAWAWPATPDAWRPLAEHQLVALEQLVSSLIAAAETGRIERWQRRRLAALAAVVGVELRQVSITIDGRELELWVVTEPPEDRRGRGAYVIRLGPLATKVELLLQAPHIRFDRHTGTLALRMLLEGDRARALFLNSAHRFRQLDGSRAGRGPARTPTRNPTNPADAAHNPEHPFARTTARVLEQREVVIVQLHGFSRDAANGDPEMIVSSGLARPNPASTATVRRLRASLPERSCAEFGVDTDRLGARRNVQAWSARATGRCFVHIELAEPLRVELLEAPELRSRFVAAVLEGATEELDGGCP